MDYDGVRAAFLIDVFVKSAKHFNAAIKHIIKRHHMNLTYCCMLAVFPLDCTVLLLFRSIFRLKTFTVGTPMARKRPKRIQSR
jgi:hypothetical protein